MCFLFFRKTFLISSFLMTDLKHNDAKISQCQFFGKLYVFREAQCIVELKSQLELTKRRWMERRKKGRKEGSEKENIILAFFRSKTIIARVLIACSPRSAIRMRKLTFVSIKDWNNRETRRRGLAQIECVYVGQLESEWIEEHSGRELGPRFTT